MRPNPLDKNYTAVLNPIRWLQKTWYIIIMIEVTLKTEFPGIQTHFTKVKEATQFVDRLRTNFRFKTRRSDVKLKNPFDPRQPS